MTEHHGLEKQRDQNSRKGKVAQYGTEQPAQHQMHTGGRNGNMNQRGSEKSRCQQGGFGNLLAWVASLLDFVDAIPGSSGRYRVSAECHGQGQNAIRDMHIRWPFCVQRTGRCR